MTTDLHRVVAERDLYRRLLDLGQQSDIAPFLSDALALLVQSSGAHRGYLELYGDDERTDRHWSIAQDLSPEQVETVREALSRGIIAQALATGETIVTDCAWLDPRFSERESVMAGKIEAVLCAPIGSAPPLGVLYLQGGEGRGLFSEEERSRTETVARLLAPLAERLIASEKSRLRTDPTRPFRERLRLDGAIGASAALAAVFKAVDLVAGLDVTVLLTGETGTGKTDVARLIHANGNRAAQPFVELNCAAFPENLVESELFGAAQGAHSTAVRKVVGKVEAAERGTLFLDEIGELALAAQAKLLQLIESRQYYPLGSAEAVRADVRVIAATNSDLKRAVAERRFRDDLYHRLQGFPVRLPTLAERREDIRELADFFCRTFCERHHLARLELSRTAIRALESAEWPGNIRDLQHAVQAGSIRASGEGARQIERPHLFPEEPAVASEARVTFQEATRQFQAQLVQEALEDTGWNVMETARRLDLTRSHVYNLINAFGLERTR